MIPSFPGFGLGLRKQHYADFLDDRIDVDFLEVISENFMIDGGRPRRILRDIRARYPVALHGVSMSIGSADGLDGTYLARLRALVDDIVYTGAENQYLLEAGGQRLVAFQLNADIGADEDFDYDEASRAAIASSVVLMPTRWPPIARTMPISAGVS